MIIIIINYDNTKYIRKKYIYIFKLYFNIDNVLYNLNNNNVEIMTLLLKTLLDNYWKLLNNNLSLFLKPFNYFYCNIVHFHEY